METTFSVSPPGWASWLRWLWLSVAGLVAGFIIFLLVGVTAGRWIDNIVPSAVFGLILGTIFGTTFGVAHRRFLARYLADQGRWLPATAVGFALAGGIVVGVLGGDHPAPPLVLRLTHAFVVGLVLGFSQWLVLRGRMRGPVYLWIPFTIAAWIVGELATVMVQPMVAEPLPLMIVFLIGAALPGIGLIWLLRQQLQEPATLRTDSEIPPPGETVRGE